MKPKDGKLKILYLYRFPWGYDTHFFFSFFFFPFIFPFPSLLLALFSFSLDIRDSTDWTRACEISTFLTRLHAFYTLLWSVVSRLKEKYARTRWNHVYLLETRYSVGEEIDFSLNFGIIDGIIIPICVDFLNLAYNCILLYINYYF